MAEEKDRKAVDQTTSAVNFCLSVSSEAVVKAEVKASGGFRAVISLYLASHSTALCTSKTEAGSLGWQICLVVILLTMERGRDGTRPTEGLYFLPDTQMSEVVLIYIISRH